MNSPESLNEFLPEFLQDHASMHEYFRKQVQGLNSQEKGTFFEQLATEIAVEYSETGLPVGQMTPAQTKDSWDEGIDIEFQDDRKSQILLVQVKWNIDSVDEFDSVLSKFSSYSEKNYALGEARQLPLFSQNSAPKIRVEFMIVTLKKSLNNIINRYKKDRRPSREFYDKLAQQDSLHIIDGNKILDLLRINFSRFCGILPSIRLDLQFPPLKIDNVYIGVVSAEALRQCYEQAGEAIFFENIRLFKGEENGQRSRGKNREPVNTEIIKTMRQEPEKMLSRNNGITFRAGTVTISPDAPCQLQLDKASIVNGCQTTICVVKSLELANGDKKATQANILVKIVQTEDSWDIAEAANFQNRVDQIDLKLAKYLRPQMALQAGIQAGINVEMERLDDPYALLSRMSIARTTYTELKLLFLGLFSRSPSNSLNADYNELNYALLDEFLAEDDSNTPVLSLILEVQRKAIHCSEVIADDFSQQFADLFKRFLQKESYRSFLTLTTVCLVSQHNFYSSSELNLNGLRELLQAARNSDDQRFAAGYRAAFMALASASMGLSKSRDEILKAMHSEVRKMSSRSGFDNLYMLALEQLRP